MLTVVELGDDIRKCTEDRTLVIANHQSTADVPMLMSTFNPRLNVLPNLMWIMDQVFKFTNFGIVSIIHQDFFILSVSIFVIKLYNYILEGVWIIIIWSKEREILSNDLDSSSCNLS